MIDQPIHITDDRGRICCALIDAEEPSVASVVLINGEYGNAWQRWGNDGLWHSTTGAKRRWSQLLRMRNLVLIYEAPERSDRPSTCVHGRPDCTVKGRHEHVPVTTWAPDGQSQITRY